MLYFETSAKEGNNVNEAFIEMVKMGIKRESNNVLNMPPSIGGNFGGNDGGLKLNNKKKNPTSVQGGRCC